MNRFEERKETIFDHETNLEWEKEHSGPMTWAEAVKYAKKIGNGWRLPTRNELISLIDDRLFNPASSFPEMPFEQFWSSSSYAGSASHAWFVYFGYGYVDNLDKTNTFCVRCVRGATVVTTQ